MTNAAVQFTYDQVPYPSLSHASSHPDCLATLARLVGMKPAAVDHCRVLELGCGVGGNLIPLACALPDSKFTGIDLSGHQIEAGRQKITTLGLINIVLEQKDILDVGPEFGQFDYIVAHGVFSWVPPAVQEKVLEICRQNLAPQGVAFVSYNTYPGWYMINIARGIMRYYTRKITDPHQRAEEARSTLQWFSGASESDTNGYYGYLKMYVDYLFGRQDEDDHSPKEDSALLHDELEDINLPLYFYEFVDRAAGHGLQYLGEVEETIGGKKLTENLEYLRRAHPSLIDMEQSYDFLRNRTFRRTLLCHQEVVIDRKVTISRIAEFFISSGARPVSDKPDIAGKSIEQFRIRNGATFSTDHPLSKAAMLCLRDSWPKPMKFEELFNAALLRLENEKRQQGDPSMEPPGEELRKGDDLRLLAANLLKAFDYSNSLVELHTYDSSLCSQAGARPVASQWAVLQAMEPDQKWVTNLRHERVQLDPFDRFLLIQLDGKKDRSDLLEIFLKGPVAEGVLTVEAEGKSLSDVEFRGLLAEEIETRLTWLAKAALIVNLPK